MLLKSKVIIALFITSAFVGSFLLAAYFSENRLAITTQCPATHFTTIPPIDITGAGGRPDITIEGQESQDLAIGVTVGDSTPPDTYILDVKIIDSAGDQYGNTKKLYVEVP